MIGWEERERYGLECINYTKYKGQVQIEDKGR